MRYLLVLIASFLIIPVNQSPEDRLREIDQETEGTVGVYLSQPESDEEFTYNAGRDWYLASTIKIPLAIVILQKAEKGELSLDDELELQESDFVDGSGDLLYQQPGTTYTILELIEKMIEDSDSTASDMLMRMLGENEFNTYINEHLMPEGINYITTILRVRYEAYGQIHERARELSNIDYVNLKEFSPLDNRLEQFMKLTNTTKEELKANSIVEGFEHYYETGLNTGKLEAMGEILEKLATGELLNETHTNLLLDIMGEVTTGDNRIKAGLPDEIVFVHKTGTQIGRACNMGVIFPENDRSRKPVVAAVCVEKFGPLNEAEQAMEKVGHLITETWF